eukprot:Gb_23703 [translate_table: standard]
MSQLRAESASVRLPRKRFYRARAHSNPLSDSHFPVPVCPAQFDYAEHFPAYFPTKPQDDSKFSTSSPNLAAKNEDREAAAEKNEDLETKTAKLEDATKDSQVNGSKPRGTSGTCVPLNEREMKVQFADIGCGFGGLLVKLATMYPSTLMIGMELRDKVTEYVKERILALRKAHPGQYQNVSVVRTNSMKFIPNYFEKGQLQKMFFLFPDPHFKEKNHRRRVISVPLLAEYAYAIAVGGILYTVTDVEELGEWMNSCLDAHPLFDKVLEEELELDPVVKLLTTATEEGQKVARNEGQTFRAIYRRIAPVEGSV